MAEVTRREREQIGGQELTHEQRVESWHVTPPRSALWQMVKRGRKMGWTVIDYVREEVERQGHDTEVLDGIERVSWMLNGWEYALHACHRNIEGADIVAIGKLIERRKNASGLRTVGVRVGSRICPNPNEVPRLLDRLMEIEPSMKPLEFYKEFEEIHPFVDGNGRTGKILLNWKNGTLLKPIFPPADLFGEPIRNP